MESCVVLRRIQDSNDLQPWNCVCEAWEECKIQDSLYQTTVQGGGDGLMVWACMTAKGLGPIVRVDGHVNAKKYIDILTNIVEPFMDDNMPISSMFQHDNAP